MVLLEGDQGNTQHQALPVRLGRQLGPQLVGEGLLQGARDAV